MKSDHVLPAIRNLILACNLTALLKYCLILKKYISFRPKTNVEANGSIEAKHKLVLKLSVKEGQILCL